MFHHLKLIMNKQFISRDGEVSWHQYSSAIKQIMVNLHDTPCTATWTCTFVHGESVIHTLCESTHVHNVATFRKDFSAFSHWSIHCIYIVAVQLTFLVHVCAVYVYVYVRLLESVYCSTVAVQYCMLCISSCTVSHVAEE